MLSESARCGEVLTYSSPRPRSEELPMAWPNSCGTLRNPAEHTFGVASLQAVYAFSLLVCRTIFRVDQVTVLCGFSLSGTFHAVTSHCSSLRTQRTSRLIGSCELANFRANAEVPETPSFTLLLQEAQICRSTSLWKSRFSWSDQGSSGVRTCQVYFQRCWKNT